jgi:hypothetical protein
MPLSASAERIAVFAADVGSRKKFGWASAPGDQCGNSIGELAKAMVRMGRDGFRISLGFECPLSIPCPGTEMGLGKQRDGEKGKPWSAGAGANAAILGMQQLCWLLRRLGRSLDVDKRATIDWGRFQTGRFKLFLWEAFITGSAKTDSDIDDARKAVQTFVDTLPDPRAANAVTCKKPVSIAGMALLWSGWSSDLTLLHKTVLVLKP